jgi:hypothetical protein
MRVASFFDVAMRAVSVAISMISLAAIFTFGGAREDEQKLRGQTTPVVTVNPILFVTQVPPQDSAVDNGRFPTFVFSQFANHDKPLKRAPPGGDLMIRYTDGTLRYLTRELGYGDNATNASGVRVQGANAISVRDPAMHWGGDKALFSMAVGVGSNTLWQIYEITGLSGGPTSQITITKLPSQPPFHNVSPTYDTQDNILFTSDTPIDYNAAAVPTHNVALYPMRDEDFTARPAVTGIWKLIRSTGQFSVLNNTPTGVFSPFVDSFGRVIFTRWDRLSRVVNLDFQPGPTNRAATETAAHPFVTPEVFPEREIVFDQRHLNHFSPWEINQDGTAELTVNHVGRHEFNFCAPLKIISPPPALKTYIDTLRTNTNCLDEETGITEMRENPNVPGQFFGTQVEFVSDVGGRNILRFDAAPSINPRNMAITKVTPTSSLTVHAMNPLPMSDGKLIVVATPSQNTRQHRLYDTALIPPANTLLTPTNLHLADDEGRWRRRDSRAAVAYVSTR